MASHIDFNTASQLIPIRYQPMYNFDVLEIKFLNYDNKDDDWGLKLKVAFVVIEAAKIHQLPLSSC